MATNGAAAAMVREATTAGPAATTAGPWMKDRVEAFRAAVPTKGAAGAKGKAPDILTATRATIAKIYM